MTFFTTNNPKIYMKPQKTPNYKNNAKKKEQSYLSLYLFQILSSTIKEGTIDYKLLKKKGKWQIPLIRKLSKLEERYPQKRSESLPESWAGLRG